MVGDFVLAVDGGATKTQMVLMEMGTGKLYFRRGGSSSHETLPGGFDEMTFVLSGMIGDICREAGIEPEDICFSSLGMAGMDLPFQLRRTEGILRAIGLGEFRLQNDAFLPVLAEAADGCGIGIINGTGFSAAAVDAFGDRMQLGGFHGCSDDFGGGQWYAERAVAAAYRSAYMGGEPTELCERIAAALQVPEAAGLIERVALAGRRDPQGTERKLCVCLHEAAEAGDEISREIFEDSAMECAARVRQMLLQMDFAGRQSVPVILAGGQFQNGCRYFREMAVAMMPDCCRAQVMAHPPVLGALFDALRARRFEITPKFRAEAAASVERMAAEA